MFEIDIGQVRRLAPHATGEYIVAFADADNIFAKYEVSDRLRVCHFFAQILAETGGLRVFRESLNYSALRLTQVWPRHFPTLEAAEPYAHNEQALGNYIYGPGIHPSLGNTEPGDGFRFRGRGLLQMTGRAAYKKYGDLIGASLLNNPDLAFDHRYSLALAAAEFGMSRHNGASALTWSDRDDVVEVTYAVNGGQNGIDQRRLWLQRAKDTFIATSPNAAAVVAMGGSASRAIANAGRTEVA